MQVTVTDQLLLRLAANRNVRAQSPHFARLYAASRNRGCGKCRKRRPNSQAQILLGIKRALLTDERLRATVKQAAGSSLLVVHARDGKGVVKRVV
jgi:hypothetical protein